MSLSKVVIVYSPGQARRRTVILPDDDSQVPIHTANLAPGEAVVVVPLGLYQEIGPDACLEQVTGRVAQSDRCAVVDECGVVIGLMPMDPAIDRHHPLGTLHADPDGTAVVGTGYHQQAYVAPKQ